MKHVPEHFIDKVEEFISVDELRELLERLSDQSDENSNYQVEEDKDGFHEFGRGGWVHKFTLLKKGNKTVLVSLRDTSYDTYRDDSEDYPMSEERKTYLIEEDPVARQIFKFIKSK